MVNMSAHRLLVSLVAAAGIGCLAVASTASQAATPIVRQLAASGVGSLKAQPLGVDAGSGPEFDPAMSGEAEGPSAYGGVITNRSIAKGPGQGASANSGKKAKSNPELNLNFAGLNLYQQRYANGGNQFTVEPPDQALCVGNGYVVEAVNDVMRVFDSSGNPVTGVVDLNTFYGYPAAINRSNGKYGPSITDPSCLFDPDTNRFYMVVLTLDRVGTTSKLNGNNHLDIAVSQSGDPTGGWTIYRLPVQNNGTDGTPDHGCPGGYCLGDYPHIGADAYGFYITTNEFPVFEAGYMGVNVYAFSKRALAGGPAVAVSQFFVDANLYPAFTIWPAQAPAGQNDQSAGGTEFLLSSDAVFYDSGTSSNLWLWSLTSTSTLDTATPALNLGVRPVAVSQYGVPDVATQKAGDYPLGQSLGDPLGVLDTNDSRMQQVFYANGKLWGALDTALTIDGSNVAGIAYYILNPHSAKVVKQGYLGLSGNHLTYPAVAVTASGRGVIAFTVTGPDYSPSAGYAPLDALVGAGDVRIAGAGLGPQDGFTEYAQYTDRPRWGDYGAAALDGSSIWIASEFVGQTCTLGQWTVDFTCGHTRAQLGNWGTSISKLTP